MFCGISLNSLCKMHKIHTRKLSEKADFVRAQSFQIEITLCSCYNLSLIHIWKKQSPDSL